MDLLADVLSVTGVRGTLGVRLEAGEAWGKSWTTVSGAAIYAVTAGTAWLRLADRAPRQLMPGDVALLPTGSAHTLVSDPDRPPTSVRVSDAERAQVAGSVLRLGSGKVRTHIVAAAYEYDPAVSEQVFTSLPEVVHIRGDHGGSGLDDTVRLLAGELTRPGFATAVVLNRLVDVLLMQVLRVWLAENPAQARGSWLGVLSDPLVSVAMTKLHQAPARAWTTESLAAELAVSRTTLARRFRAAVGETPGSYLTRWRMDLAAIRLRDSDDTLDVIARSVGYTSEYAFSRAFRRSRRQAPGHYRTTARRAVANNGNRQSSGG